MKRLLLLAILMIVNYPIHARSNYSWTNSGSCYEVTPSNKKIRSVHLDYCRGSRGSSYAWTNSGSCYEVTPSNNKIASVHLDYCRQSQGSSYAWTNSGSCYEVTPSYKKISSVHLDYCRQSEGSSYAWTNSGSCYEVTSSNKKIGNVHLDYCRQSQGSSYAWSNSGSCYEVTPSNNKIGSVHLDYCRYSTPSVIKPNITKPRNTTKPRSQNYNKFEKQAINLANVINSIAQSYQYDLSQYNYERTLKPLKSQVKRLEKRIKNKVDKKTIRNTLIHLNKLINQAARILLNELGFYHLATELKGYKTTIDSLISQITPKTARKPLRNVPIPAPRPERTTITTRPVSPSPSVIVLPSEPTIPVVTTTPVASSSLDAVKFSKALKALSLKINQVYETHYDHDTIEPLKDYIRIALQREKAMVDYQTMKNTMVHLKKLTSVALSQADTAELEKELNYLDVVIGNLTKLYIDRNAPSTSSY